MNGTSEIDSNNRKFSGSTGSMSQYKNHIKEALTSGKFVYTLEYVPETAGKTNGAGFDFLAQEAASLRDDARICGVNIGDRVKSMDSLSTVDCGKVAADASGKMPLLHLAGKDREPAEAVAVFQRAFDAGLDTFLIVSGDRVLNATRPGRTRYFDSVNAIVAAKEMRPTCFAAAAVAPFKYREEELLNQYLKMAKKINAGADYLITNCGWDMDKFRELIWYRDARGFKIPIVANLLMPALGWARSINARRLPGVYMADDLFKKIEEEHKHRKTESERIRLYRLALQIVGVKFMGYAGVQLSGIETYASLCRAIEKVSELEDQLQTYEAWEQAWRDAHTFPGGKVVQFGPADGLYLFGNQRPKFGSLSGPLTIDGISAGPDEIRKYETLDAIDKFAFHKDAIGGKIFSSLLSLIDAVPGGNTAICSVEHSIKKPILGCEMCGFCRIPYLFYICPETCPKGLANGPCAGTDDNTCEFKDRECIHNKKYRIAKDLGRLSELETVYVPAVAGTRGTSSWANQFNESIPKVKSLREIGERSKHAPDEDENKNSMAPMRERANS